MPNKVVFIDDDALLVSVFSAFLRSKGYVVSTDADAAGNVYVVDYHCGGENGIEISRAVKSNNPIAKIIMISGLQRKAATEVQAALGDGLIDIFLPKPFSPADLLQKIDSLAESTD